MKGKYKRVWTNEGPDRSGTGDKLYLQKCAPNMTFAASLPTHSHPFTIDWCTMQARGWEAVGIVRVQREWRCHAFASGFRKVLLLEEGAHSGYIFGVYLNF